MKEQRRSEPKPLEHMPGRLGPDVVKGHFSLSQGTRNCLFRRSIDVGSNQVMCRVLTGHLDPLEAKQRLIIGSLSMHC
jgi:hypothetical protein